MKLRLRDNSVRLRLTKGEVEAIARGDEVTAVTQVANGVRFTYGLQGTRDSASSVTLGGQELVVRVPHAELSAWANTETVSIEATQPLGNGESLRILVEKDFACLADRPFEDDSDAFPHPGS